jgi:hypothetical protein
MFTEADEVHLLTKDKAVCCSVCNYEYKINPSYTVPEKSGKPFENKI